MLLNCGALEDQPLRVPWRARRSNQSILSEVNPEYSLGGLILKLKLQYFGHLMLRDDLLEKTLMMGKPEHLTCLLRNLYAGQEATVRTGHGTTDWFQIGKGVSQGCILSAQYIMRKVGLDKHKLESRLPGEISLTSDKQMTSPLWQKVKKT